VISVILRISRNSGFSIGPVSFRLKFRSVGFLSQSNSGARIPPFDSNLFLAFGNCACVSEVSAPTLGICQFNSIESFPEVFAAESFQLRLAHMSEIVWNKSTTWGGLCFGQTFRLRFL
jgi:hypothetical protein